MSLSFDRAFTGELARLRPCPPFPALTGFERVALRTVAAHAVEDRDALTQQIANCTVLDRINTIVGFYTAIGVDRALAPPLGESRSPLGGQAELPQAKYGLVFLLWVRDGYLETLEGALNHSNADIFAGSDLSELTLSAIAFDDGTRVVVSSDGDR